MLVARVQRVRVGVCGRVRTGGRRGRHGDEDGDLHHAGRRAALVQLGHRVPHLALAAEGRADA